MRATIVPVFLLFVLTASALPTAAEEPCSPQATAGCADAVLDAATYMVQTVDESSAYVAETSKGAVDDFMHAQVGSWWDDPEGHATELATERTPERAERILGTVPGTVDAVGDSASIVTAYSLDVAGQFWSILYGGATVMVGVMVDSGEGLVFNILWAAEAMAGWGEGWAEDLAAYASGWTDRAVPA